MYAERITRHFHECERISREFARLNEIERRRRRLHRAAERLARDISIGNDEARSMLCELLAMEGR